jgi:hypothetical protein
MDEHERTPFCELALQYVALLISLRASSHPTLRGRRLVDIDVALMNICGTIRQFTRLNYLGINPARQTCINHIVMCWGQHPS